MSVFLTILKILLFFVLGVLALALLLILLVLIVPVRYLGEGSYKEDTPEGVFKVSWLLHLLSVRIGFSEKEPGMVLRIFGIPVKNEKKTSEKSEEKPETGKSKKREEKPKEKPPEKPSGEPSGGKQKAGGETAEEKEPFIDRMNEGWQDTKEKILQKIDAFQDKIDDFRKKLKFIQNERTEEAIRFLLKKVKKILKHVLPRRLSGNIRFGMESPDQTGTVLGIAAMLLPIHKNRILLEPDFNEKIFEGEMEFRGKIRVGYLLCQGIAVLLNRNCRITYKRYKKYFSKNKEVKNG